MQHLLKKTQDKKTRAYLINYFLEQACLCFRKRQSNGFQSRALTLPRTLFREHRYMRLRKKLMKTDELHMYDLYTSLVADADVKISFEKAKEEVLDATAVLGKLHQLFAQTHITVQDADVLMNGFDQVMIDFHRHVGRIQRKRAGRPDICAPLQRISAG